MTDRSVYTTHTMPVRLDTSSSSPRSTSAARNSSSRDNSRSRHSMTLDDNEALWRSTFARSGTPASERMKERSERSRSRSRHGEVKKSISTTSTSATSAAAASSPSAVGRSGSRGRRQRSNSPDNNYRDPYNRLNSMDSSPSKIASSMTRQSSFREEKHSSGSGSSSSVHRGREPTSQSSQYYDRSSARSKSRGREPITTNTTTTTSTSRSKSRTRTIESSSSNNNTNTTTRSTTPRPVKKLGCLGGSTDMTRRGSSAVKGRTSTPGRERTSSNTAGSPTSQHQHIQDGVKQFEQEMRDSKRYSQDEMMKKMNYGRAPSRDSYQQQSQLQHPQQLQLEQDQRGRQSVGGGTSSNRGRSRGRSQSRPKNIDQQQQHHPSSRSISRSRKKVMPRDPSCGASPSPSKHRSKSRDPTRRSKSKSRHDAAVNNNDYNKYDDDDRRRFVDDAKSVKSSKSVHSHGTSRSKSRSRHQQQQQQPDDGRSVGPISSGMSIMSRASAKLSVLSGGRSVSGRSVSGKSFISGLNPDGESSDEESSLTPSTGPLSSYTGGSSRMMGTNNSVANHSYSSKQQHRHQQQQLRQTRPATPNRTPEGSLNGDETDKSDIDEKEIMTYLFDRRGYCVRHPQVRLRKKKILGGWQTVITNCPECCLEEYE